MVVTISSKSTPEEIKKALAKLEKGLKPIKANKKPEKKFDAFKYCGVIKLKGDPMKIQKAMRNEWE
jgi:hypothetical protein